MAYDRYDNRGSNRGYGDDRQRNYRGDDREERGFFQRAADEVSSWFGDESSGQRRDRDDRYGRDDDRYSQQGYAARAYDDSSRDRYGRDDDRTGRSERPAFFGGGSRETGMDRQQGQRSGRYESRDQGGYRPMTGDYGRGQPSGGYGSQDYGRSGYGSQNFDRGGQGAGFGSQDYGQQQYGRQDRFQDQDGPLGRSRMNEQDRYGASGSSFGRDQDDRFGLSSTRGRSTHDDHYSSWRQRQIEDLDRDYDEYRREHQSRFENEFSSFRTQRQTKRQLLGQIREHAEVLDESGQRIGTVDKVRGDKVILTKNDPEAGGVHRSFGCSLLDRVEDGKVYLTGSKDSIRSRLEEERDEGRSNSGWFGGERERASDDRMTERRPADTGQDGPHILDKSFSGTYDDGGHKAETTPLGSTTDASVTPTKK